MYYEEYLVYVHNSYLPLTDWFYFCNMNVYIKQSALSQTVYIFTRVIKLTLAHQPDTMLQEVK